MSPRPEDTTMGEAPSASALGIPDLEQKLLAAFQSAADPVKIGICSILGIGLAEGQAQAQASSDGKRKHTSETDDVSRAKRARTSVSPTRPPSRAELIDFRSIRNPDSPINCIIQVNKGPYMGSLKTCNVGYSVKVYLDGGISTSPCIGLQFKYPGSDGHEVGRVTWHVDSRVENRWIIQALKYVPVTEATHDKAVHLAAAINQCESDDSLGRLMCITLELTASAKGVTQKASEDASIAVRTCLNAIFGNKKDYTLRIWFLIPWASRSNQETTCLSAIRYLFHHRQEPLSLARDINGVSFADSTRESKGGISSAGPGRRRATQAFMRESEPEVPTGPTAASVSNTQASDQEAKTAAPIFQRNQGPVEHHRDPYANRAVPSFGLALPVVPIQTRPTRTANPKTWGTPKPIFNPETQPNSSVTASTMAARLSKMGTKTTFTAGPLVAPSLPKRPASDDEDEDGEIEEGEELATVASPSNVSRSDSTADLTHQANLQLQGAMDVRSAEGDLDGSEAEAGAGASAGEAGAGAGAEVSARKAGAGAGAEASAGKAGAGAGAEASAGVEAGARDSGLENKFAGMTGEDLLKDDSLMIDDEDWR